MEENKLPLNNVAYTILIEGMCKAGNLVAAKGLFSQLSSKGSETDVRTYSIMIALLGGGLIDEATNLFRQMEDALLMIALII